MKFAYVPVRPVNASSDGGKVCLLDGTAKQVPSPTNQDILNAINDLHKKISELSKNQQILETKLSNVNWNVIHGAILAASYAKGGAFCIAGDLEAIQQQLINMQKNYSNTVTGFNDPSPYFNSPPQWK